MGKLYVQYGCGLSSPAEWVNFDVSPTLRIQKTPILGKLLKNSLNTSFPSNVLYGDIIKGLPIADNSCDGLYSSHTLEHLSLTDFKKALMNSFKILKRGGIFRCVVPDLEYAARQYINCLDRGEKMASIEFMESTLLGIKVRPHGIKGFLGSFWGNSHHLWMWDKYSLGEELKIAGFKDVRICKFGDCEDPMFAHVESSNRFEFAAAVEGRKL